MITKIRHLIRGLLRKHALAKRLGCRFSHASQLDDRSGFGQGVVIGGSSIIVDSNLGRNTYVAGAKVAHADVGSFCSIGPEALIGPGSHPTHFVSTNPLFYSTRTLFGWSFADKDLVDDTARIHIGSDVWIGARAIVFNGVRIGHGAIVGANALVNKDVPPYAIVAGVPARLLRMRFPDNVVNALLEWHWWDLSDDLLRQLAPQFCAANRLTFDAITELRNIATELQKTS